MGLAGFPHFDVREGTALSRAVLVYIEWRFSAGFSHANGLKPEILGTHCGMAEAMLPTKVGI